MLPAHMCTCTTVQVSMWPCRRQLMCLQSAVRLATEAGEKVAGCT